MWKIFVVFAVIFVAAIDADVGDRCTRNSDCNATECCQILKKWQVVSKRILPLPGSLTSISAGTCQLYRVQGESCSPLAKINGYCSCEPGTTCTHHPLTAATLVSSVSAGRKRLIAAGTYDCQPI